jgi:uncharacterized protein (TIGR02271 family)
MDARQKMQDIRQGMAVYTADGQTLGTVERMQRDTLMVGGQTIPRTAVSRVTGDGVYLDGSYATGQQEGEIRVAVAEERLSVGKREIELGQVEIRKTVTEEEQVVPVTLRREEVHIEEVDIADRPLRPEDDAFNPGVITVNLRGEEAVVTKETVVTGEVVIDTERVAEERRISDTVRKQHVEVDERHLQARTSADGEPGGRRR